MARNFRKHLIGTAGELAVANMMCLHGWVPSLTTNNCPEFDIFAYNPADGRSCVVQVKTTKDEVGNRKSSFPISCRHNVRDAWLQNLHCPYVFVHIDAQNNHKFYILSVDQFRDVVTRTDDEYFNKDRVKPIKADYPIAVSIKDLQPFENMWENLWK